LLHSHVSKAKVAIFHEITNVFEFPAIICTVSSKNNAFTIKKVFKGVYTGNNKNGGI